MTHTFEIKNSGLFIAVVCIIYTIIAFQSSGFYHPDEHYQIIEFANFKLGLIDINQLAWEFKSLIRPSLQPAICYLIFKFLYFLGITNGYNLAFILRIITGILSIVVTKFFVNSYLPLIHKKLKKPFIFFSYFLWFLPFINIRFSSETWSGLIFMLVVGIAHKLTATSSKSTLTIIGILSGLSFLFRFQSGVMIMGMMVWLFLIRKIGLKNLFHIMLPIIIIIIIGVFIDRWLYGTFTFTPYNYFYVNIVKGVASTFGISPWYEILFYIIKGPGPFGYLIILSLIFALFYETKNLIIWIIIPFLLVHMIISHKEMRFLFPIAYYSPIIFFLTIQRLYNYLPKFLIQKPIISSLLIVMLLINTIGIIAITSTSAGTKTTSITKYIFDNYSQKKLNIILYQHATPFEDQGNPKNSYYNSKGIHLQDLNKLNAYFVEQKHQKNKINLLIAYDMDMIDLKGLENIKIHKVYQNIPEYLKVIYKVYDKNYLQFGMSIYQLD
jgi:phosphatidylinositol glycan class B